MPDKQEARANQLSREKLDIQAQSILNLPPVLVRMKGRAPYESTWQAMQAFTQNRTEDTQDELWCLEHEPVFTQGQAGKTEHVLRQSGIPIVKTDRGGQVTYHGPGQLVVYPLLNLKRLRLGVRELVTCIENSVIETLAEFDIESAAKPDAPGVYVSGRKIASLGLRVRRGCSFHGVAVNFDADLSPFEDINPCGYQGLQMVNVKDLLADQKLPTMDAFARRYVEILTKILQLSPQFA